MKLIIAEKPSLAQTIAKTIGYSSFKRQDGYLENKDYIVTWAFGHLFELLDVAEYSPDYDPEEKQPWSLDELPFYPPRFKFTLKRDPKTKKTDPGVRKQFNTIKKLIDRKDVDTIINAGDSDREGEIIVRLILMNAQNKKPVERLWMPDQTPETIREGLSDIKDDKEYNNLANEGMARTFIDWLYGINLTRYATLKSGSLLRVGRVITEIVRVIYERDMEIKNFEPQKYYGIVSKEVTNGEEIELTSKHEFLSYEKANADKLCKEYNNATATVTKATKENKYISPGKLYSLSKLEGVMGKRYKMPVQETLDTVQKLYESGYVTYPRTNTEYMATAEKGKAKNIISKLSAEGFPVAFRDSKSIFDDSKIESHSALTPTTKIPPAGSLASKEQLVYDTIRNRFVAVFCSEPCEVSRSTVVITLEDKDGPLEIFTLEGDVMLKKGWTAFDEYTKKDKILPALSVGDIINKDFKPVEKETAPPKHFTTTTLNNYLRSPFRKEKEYADSNDDEEYSAILNGLEIGTEATRPSIIMNAVSSGYISYKKDVYTIEPLGEKYINVLKELYITMDKTKTVEISKALKKVFKNEMSIGESVEIVKNEIDSVLSHRDIVVEQIARKGTEAVGICPLCGSEVRKNPRGYGCSGYKGGCKFFVASPLAGKRLSDNQVATLLEKGKTNLIKGFTAKSGKKFDARLQLNEGKVEFAFDNAPKEAPDIASKCPKCGGNLNNEKWAWVCSEGCGFKISHQIANYSLSAKDVKDLLDNGRTQNITKFKSKAGKKFSACLVFDEDYNIKFEF